MNLLAIPNFIEFSLNNIKGYTFIKHIYVTPTPRSKPVL